MANDRITVFKPQAGFQEKFVSSNIDFVVGGGVLNCGKSFAAILTVAEPSTDSRFRACFLRNNLGDLKAGGGLISEFKNVYGRNVTAVESGDPHIDFPSGSRVDLTHISDQSRDKVLQRFKGRQYDMIYFDEGTGFTWECFTAVYSRNRGTANWTGKVRMTTNPKRSHWLRIFLDWYIAPDGFIDPERDGVVRYFYVNGPTVKDVVWGDSKEEVYKKCKISIDRVLKKVNGEDGSATYEDMIKSFTFYLGKMSENRASISNNKGYAGSVAIMGGKTAEQNLEGNWNVDPDELSEALIPQTAARDVFTNDKMTNGDRWVTVDLAEEGTDNFLAIAWDGFHILDILIQGRTTPRRNAELISMFAKQNDVGDSHIIYDAANGKYINDYIPEAIPFISYSRSIGVYMFNFQSLKDECYDRLVKTIKEGRLSCEESVGDREYTHQKIKSEIPISTEFVEECSVVRFKPMPSGKRKLYNKKEMNAMLGKGRSMDLLDPCAMRMMPVLHINVGDELVQTAVAREEEYSYNSWRDKNSIYSDSFWA